MVVSLKKVFMGDPLRWDPAHVPSGSA